MSSAKNLFSTPPQSYLALSMGAISPNASLFCRCSYRTKRIGNEAISAEDGPRPASRAEAESRARSSQAPRGPTCCPPKAVPNSDPGSEDAIHFGCHWSFCGAISGLHNALNVNFLITRRIE